MEFQKAIVVGIKSIKAKDKDIPSGLFGDSDTHEDFTSFTDICTFGDEAEPAKVHVTARDDGDEAFAGTLEVVSDNVGFQACECEGAGRFRDRPGFFKDVLDGGANLVIVDEDDGV